MYPYISYLLEDLFGIGDYHLFSKIKTFGFFLSLSILFSFFTLLWAVKRRENKGLILPIRYKDNYYFPSDKIGLVVFITLISSIFGGKLFDVIENYEKLSTINVLYLFLNSGLVYYGGLIGGFLGGLVSCYIFKLPFKNLLDALSPYLMLGYSIGRLGCHLSGDGDWGIQNSQPVPKWWIFPNQYWAYDYPHNSNQVGFLIENCQGSFCHHLSPPVYPTSLFEAIFAIILGIILLFLNKKFERNNGVLFMFFLFFMSIERFFIEFIRVNPKYYFFKLYLSQAQYISILIILLTLIQLTFIFKKHYLGKTL